MLMVKLPSSAAGIVPHFSTERPKKKAHVRIYLQIRHGHFFKKRVKLDAHYTMPDSFIRGRVYIEKDNPGVNVEYIREMPKDGTLNINGGVFKDDAAFQIEYNAKLDKNTKMVIGAYGTTKYKETGVYGRLEF